MSRRFVIQRFSRDGGGEWEARMGSPSAPCADGGISQATAGGGDGAVVARDGSEGGERRLKWGGRWRNRLVREWGVRWWWIRVAWWGDLRIRQAKVVGTRWWWGLPKWWGCWLDRLARAGGARCWGRLLRGWLGLAMVVGGNDRGVQLLRTKRGRCWRIG